MFEFGKVCPEIEQDSALLCAVRHVSSFQMNPNKWVPVFVEIRRRLRSMRKYFVVVLVLLTNALILSAADVTGTWKGTFTPENHDPGPALIILKQTGETITGTAGPDESERGEIANGKVTGEKMTFDLPRDQGTMKFVLVIDGDTLTGEATREHDGQVETAKLSLKREK